MKDFIITPIDLANIDAVYPETMTSLFWEQGARRARITGSHHSRAGKDSPEIAVNDDLSALDADKVPHSPEGELKRAQGHIENSGDMDRDLPHQDVDQVRLEKEAWLNAVFLSWGSCGYSLRLVDSDQSSAEGRRDLAEDSFRTVGTLLFSPPRFCPTTFSFPSGPISPDAIALTSFHFDPFEVDDAMSRALLLTTLHNLAQRGVNAVEAFGCSGSAEDERETAEIDRDKEGSNDTEASLLFEELEQSLGAARSLKPCHSNSLSAINHEFGEMIRTRTLLEAGFRVMTPHPVHPKLRIELDAELDWDEAVGHALEKSSNERFIRAKLFSL